MAGIASVATQALNSAQVAGGGTPPDLKTLARTGDLHSLTVYARQHSRAERQDLEKEMIAAKRTGDVSRLNQALKQKDFDVPVWLKTQGGSAGPGYLSRPPSDTAYKVGTSPAWDGLVKAGKVTASEQRVISRMAINEGGQLDSLQAYDSETVTLGAMQKTINPGGTGELAKQVYDFSQANPAKYQSLFADHGWTVSHTGKGQSASDYTLKLTVDGKTMTPRETYAYIKDETHPEHWNTALDPLLQAGRDPDFQALQLQDFKGRLDGAMATVPAGKSYTQPISAYFTSEKGAALVLDESVNRPSHVSKTFGHALDEFYAANPKAPSDPSLWTAAQRTEYEPKIMDAYQNKRLESGMSKPAPRYDQIVNQDSPLSAAPGSFVATR